MLIIYIEEIDKKKKEQTLLTSSIKYQAYFEIETRLAFHTRLVQQVFRQYFP